MWILLASHGLFFSKVPWSIKHAHLWHTYLSCVPVVWRGEEDRMWPWNEVMHGCRLCCWIYYYHPRHLNNCAGCYFTVQFEASIVDFFCFFWSVTAANTVIYVLFVAFSLGCFQMMWCWNFVVSVAVVQKHQHWRRQSDPVKATITYRLWGRWRRWISGFSWPRGVWGKTLSRQSVAD